MKNSGTNIQIKEIAEKLGVSAGTVSIVLNGRGDAMRISKATQQRVWTAAKEMNYQPNIYARRLRSAGTEATGKIIAVFWNEEFTDDYMGRFFRGMNRAVKENNYNVEFNVQMFEYDRLHKLKDIMTSGRYSGIIIAGSADGDMDFLNANSFDLPIVLISRNVDKFHCVYINDYEVGKNTARLFQQRGHKKVGLISMQRRSYSSSVRQLGYLENCTQYQLEVKDDWIQEGEGRDYDSGYDATKRLLQGDDWPTAIFVLSPGQALGTMNACKDAGLSVPNDIEVLTYGDSEIFLYSSPTVSSVFFPVENMAENALNLLVLILENGITMPMGRLLQAEYEFRESCGGFPQEISSYQD